MTTASKVLTLFLILVLCLTFFMSVVQPVSFASAQGATYVNGVINSTTWTRAGSPYNFTGDVTINESATLIIQTGVVVNQNSNQLTINGTAIIEPNATINLLQPNLQTMNLQNFLEIPKPSERPFIEVNGKLQSVGTCSNPVHINGFAYISDKLKLLDSLIDFSQVSSGSIIENTITTSTDITTHNSLKFINSSMQGVFSGFNGTIEISNSNMSKLYFSGGTPSIRNNAFWRIEFNPRTNGETNARQVIISDNIFSGGLLINENWQNFLIQRNQITSRWRHRNFRSKSITNFNTKQHN